MSLGGDYARRIDCGVHASRAWSLSLVEVDVDDVRSGFFLPVGRSARQRIYRGLSAGSTHGSREFPTLADCLVAVAASDRPLTVDLGEVSEIGSAAVNLIVDAARRLSCRGFRLSVVPPRSVDDRGMRVLGEHVHIEWADERPEGMTRSGTRTVAVDALQGTYL